MRIATIVFLSLLCVGVRTVPGHAQSAPAVVTVTSDSVSYCQDLARRGPTAPTDEVARLWREGKTMCDQGHVRSGIRQLRRALLLARGDKTDAP